jgi:hypothetical protein
VIHFLSNFRVPIFRSVLNNIIKPRLQCSGTRQKYSEARENEGPSVSCQVVMFYINNHLLEYQTNCLGIPYQFFPVGISGCENQVGTIMISNQGIVQLELIHASPSARLGITAARFPAAPAALSNSKYHSILTGIRLHFKISHALSQT